MANWNNTRLTCNDLQRFTEIMKIAPFGEINEISFSDGAAYFSTPWGTPENGIRQLSKENPDLIFTAEYSYEDSLYSTIDIVEYRNGKSKQIDVKANYQLAYSHYEDPEKIYKPQMGEHFEQLYNKAIELFRRIDVIKETETGQKYIDFVDGIGLIIQDDNYEMHFLKGWEGRACSSASIYISKCFLKKKTTTTELVPIDDNTLPF